MSTPEHVNELTQAYEALPGSGTVLELLNLVRKIHPHLSKMNDSRVSLLWLPIVWRVGVRSEDGSEIMIGRGDSFVPYFDTLIFKLLTRDGEETKTLFPEQKIRWEAIRTQ